MKTNTLMTYSLLSHLKETNTSDQSSIINIFVPIVKKAIVEYAVEKGDSKVRGENANEIQKKIIEYFGIDIPISVLNFILNQINEEIGNSNIFMFNNDSSFIINTFVFDDIDDKITEEFSNIEFLKADFEKYCANYKYEAKFDELIKFIFSLKIDLFSNKSADNLNKDFYIPKYISLRFSDDTIFNIISDIYLGSLLSSYFEFKIDKKVIDTELLIDTNFFISLINLNTHEAYLTCSLLLSLSQKIGYKYSILYSTVDQIKILLNSRIKDFENKDIGLVQEADIFGACIRRELDRTQLEKIKDSVDRIINENNISIIHKPQIAKIVTTAEKSKKYKELIEIRKGQKLSALNDTVAYFYVQSRRGNSISEFSDVKCWFLNNSYHNDYYSGIGYKIYQRFKISANELLALVWLSNPNQSEFDQKTLAKGGLSSYIAKYRSSKIPSVKVIKDIKQRAEKAISIGSIDEKDVYSISVRMAEGQLTNGAISEMIKMPDEDFISAVKEMSKQDEEVIEKVEAQTKIITEQTKKIDKQNELLSELLADNNDNKKRIDNLSFQNRKDNYIMNELTKQSIKMNNIAWLYVFFVIVLSTIWIINFRNVYPYLTGLGTFIIFIASIFIRFLDHQNILNCLKFTFLKRSREVIKKNIINELNNTYNEE